MDSISKTYSGGTPSKKNNEYYKGDIPFIRSGDINNESTELFISESALQNSSTKLVKKGDVLYALYGATSGEVAISKIQGAINQAILAIIPHKVNGTFIASFLKRERKRILSTYLQGGQGNLSAIIVKNLLIPYTKIEEQKRIEIFLHRLNNLITLNQRKLEKLKKLKKVYLQNIFSPNILRFYNYKNEWECGKLNNLLKIKTKEPVSDPKIEDVLTVRLHTKGVDKGVRDNLNMGATAYYYRYPGEFIYGKQNIFNGGLGIVREKGISSRDVPSFVIQADPLFVYYLLARPWFYKKIEGLSNGTGSKRVHEDSLLKIKVSYPLEREEQNDIGILLKYIDKNIVGYENRIKILQNLKQFYLDNLFI